MIAREFDVPSLAPPAPVPRSHLEEDSVPNPTHRPAPTDRRPRTVDVRLRALVFGLLLAVIPSAVAQGPVDPAAARLFEGRDGVEAR